MCGIIGCVGQRDTTDVLLNGLSALEYRGYDSSGIALANSTIDVLKREGDLSQLQQAVSTDGQLHGSVGIGHTRWSTHGAPTDENAHPHTDCDATVAVVHNGIIENYQSLRAELVDAGHSFESDTDTEVVPHLIEVELEGGAAPKTAFRRAVARLEGSYALATVFAGNDQMFAARSDSPLVLGIGVDTYYLASDVPAFLDYTDRVVYLDDDEFTRLTPDGWEVTDRTGTPVQKPVSQVEWDAEETAKSGYRHYMLKEIHEQPTALRKCLRERIEEGTETITLDTDVTPTDVDAVQFVACGTSYHAAVYGAKLFQSCGISAQVFLASEYATSPAPLGSTDLVVGVTQSGETADTLSALRHARSDAKTLALTNVVGSTAARECDEVVYIRAGPEIGVAATKTFSSQAVAMNLLVLALTHPSERMGAFQGLVAALRDLPGQVQTVLDASHAETVARQLLDDEAYFFIGRGYHYPVALEGALKFKEITYEHAEGFASGELKHGPLALVSDQTPVVAIVTGDGEQARKTLGNVKEVEARSAPVVAVTDRQSELSKYAEYVLDIPETHPQLAPILANVQLQLLAYYAADALGRRIDKPRNLAKSVTVE